MQRLGWGMEALLIWANLLDGRRWSEANVDRVRLGALHGAYS